jgi:hypothetical protein
MGDDVAAIDSLLTYALENVGTGDPWREQEPGAIRSLQMKRHLADDEIYRLPHPPRDIRMDRPVVFKRLAPVAAAIGIPIPHLAAFEGL